MTGTAVAPSGADGGGKGGGDGGGDTNVGHSCSNTPPSFLHFFRQGFRHCFLLHFLGLAEPLQAVQSLTSGSFLQSFLQNLLPHFGNSGDGESGGGDGGDGEGGGGLGGGIGEAGEGHAHSSQLGSTALT